MYLTISFQGKKIGKRRADYQREYRERKKMKDHSFLEKERWRVGKYRVPITAVSENKQAEIRERNRIYQAKMREKKKRQGRQKHFTNSRE